MNLTFFTVGGALAGPFIGILDSFNYLVMNFAFDPLGALLETPPNLSEQLYPDSLINPIAYVLVVRNLITEALDPPLPSWLSGLAPATATRRQHQRP